MSLIVWGVLLISLSRSALAQELCSDAQSKTAFFPEVDSLRLQSLDLIPVVVDKNVKDVTIKLFSEEEPDWSTLRIDLVDGELIAGASNNDRSQCMHVLLPPDFELERIIADDNATLQLSGEFDVPYLNLQVVFGQFIEELDTKITVERLVLNNTGVGGVFLLNNDDSATELEVNNNGDGDTWFLGTIQDGVMRHNGTGAVYLGAVMDTMEVYMVGLGKVNIGGSPTAKLSGVVKPPSSVNFEQGDCDIQEFSGWWGYQSCQESNIPYFTPLPPPPPPAAPPLPATEAIGLGDSGSSSGDGATSGSGSDGASSGSDAETSSDGGVSSSKEGGNDRASGSTKNGTSGSVSITITKNGTNITVEALAPAPAPNSASQLAGSTLALLGMLLVAAINMMV